MHNSPAALVAIHEYAVELLRQAILSIHWVKNRFIFFGNSTSTKLYRTGPLDQENHCQKQHQFNLLLVLYILYTPPACGSARTFVPKETQRKDQGPLGTTGRPLH
jgi:hypothetical protein